MDANQVNRKDLPECPSCKKGRLQQRNGKFGAFLGCTNYPSCRYTQPIGGEQNVSANLEVPEESKQYVCPRCKKGYFVKQQMSGRTTWVCSNRSTCKTQCMDVEGVPSIYANQNK